MTWKLDHDPLGAGVFGNGDNYHGISSGEPGASDSWHLTGFMPLRDAQLIVAAPDLLRAVKDAHNELEYFHETYGDNTSSYQLLVRIRDLVAKIASDDSP